MELLAGFFGSLALLIAVGGAGGYVATKLRFPAVLGELLAGIALGALPFVASMRTDLLLSACGELGVLLLLFEIGLELTTGDLRRVGGGALRVAVLGVLASILLVGGVSWALGASSSGRGHFFVGAAMAATSMGITARVLRELGQTQSPEGRMVIAAAVIDDLLSLLVLTFVGAFATVGAASGGALVLVVAKAVGFLVGALLFGHFVLPRVFARLGQVAGEGALLLVGLTVCLAYSAVAALAGLAPAIGAFCAGLAIQPEDYKPLQHRRNDTLGDLLAPLLTVFVPLFFVLAGLRVDITAFLDPHVWLLTAAMAAAAVGGKLIAGLGAGEGPRKLVVGLGMVPRGEVTLIFATTGAAIQTGAGPLLPKTTFSAILAAVVLTTLISPLMLRRVLRPTRDRGEVSHV